MNSPPPSKFAWLWYTLIRLGIFAVLLWIFVAVLPIDPWLSAIIAAVISFCVSYIFLGRQRAEVAQQFQAARSSGGRSREDDGAEDAALEPRSEGERDG